MQSGIWGHVRTYPAREGSTISTRTHFCYRIYLMDKVQHMRALHMILLLGSYAALVQIVSHSLTRGRQSGG